MNGGSCYDGINDFSCECAPGFTGQRCEQSKLHLWYGPLVEKHFYFNVTLIQ